MLYHHTRPRPRFDIDTDQRQDLFIIRDYAARMRDYAAALNRWEITTTAEGDDEVIRLLSEANEEIEDVLSSISGKAARPNR